MTAAAEPSLESLSTTTTSTGTSALANTACRHWRRRSLALWLTISAETTGFGESGIAVNYRLRDANDASTRIPVTVQTGATLRLRERLVQLSENRLVRQNAILFSGGLVAGIGGFVFHAIAGRILGPAIYGQVAFLIALYAVGTAPALILVVVLARYTATLAARGDAGVRSLLTRTVRLIAIPCLLAVLVTSLMARPVAAFEHLGSTIPILILGFSIALIWQVAIPRGILQGLQRFTALSLNLSLELVVRTVLVYVLLMTGYAVSGAMAAVFVGLAFAFFLGLYTLRDHFRGTGTRVRLRVMAGFSMTAAAGIIGVQILYNQDVILAEHYLSSHDGGIYGGLNKIGTILFFLTLSVSQVLFPRVVEAVAKEEHPGRILLSSAGILAALGAGALLVFAVVPGLVVGVLFGPGFKDATPYVFAVGVIGLALSLDNLLVQFFMAVHDRVFVPILFAGVIAEGVLIYLFHARVGQVVLDVLVALVALLVLLTVRCYLLLPTLHADSLEEPEPALD
ncbi:MAG: lipopolysaccharide biosynthesis protein [Chloroflexi bacterium]|nr:MAG: lipopolysaccharide biosynthesis protein [Chloroflexota bacterium]